MARIRTIKPEFPQSESMGNVSREARLCFILLWTIADDSGRLRGNSRMLASLLYPYDDDAPTLINGWLDELEREGCILRYSAGGSSYLQIENWLSHQKIDKPSKSKIPNPREDSRVLGDTSSLDQDQDQDQDQEGNTPPSSVRERKPASDYTPEFEQAWAAYPSRPGNSKRDAFKAWSARIKAGAKAADIIAGVSRYAAYCETDVSDPRYIKQAATFFGPGEHYLGAWTPTARGSPAGKPGGVRHNGFNGVDYRKGVNDDGTFD